MTDLQLVQYLPWNRICVCLQTNSPISFPPVKFELIVEEDEEENVSDQEEEEEHLGEGTLQIDYNAPLDDFYALLGLKHRDHLATPKEVSRAYRKISLKFHPDRVHDKDPKEAEERYKCIQQAYETLKDPIERRIYDSSREFDDTIPDIDDHFSSPEEMYNVYGKAFLRYSRWSATRPVPKFGDANTKLTKVEKFYDFWQGFRSWRDFSYLGEFNVKDAENRDHRRWMEQQNKKEAKARKKEETQTIMALVSQAKKLDPRYQAILDEQKRRLDEMKRKKKEMKRKAAEERGRAEKEKKRKEERRRQEAIEAKIALEKQREARKKAMKQWKRWLKKATGKGGLLEEFRPRYDLLLKEGEYEDWEQIATICIPDVTIDILNEHRKAFDEMHESLTQRVAEKKKQEEEERIRREEEAKRREAERKAREFWTDKELDFLVKAVQKFPGGTVDRWERICQFLPTERSVEEVISKVKSLAKQSRKGKGRSSFVPPPRPSAPVPETPPRATEETSEKKKKKKKKKKDKEGKDKKNKKKKKETVEDPHAWTIPQQQALENALREFKGLPVNEKWSKISDAVKGKTKKECVERYKYIRAQLMAARQQTAV